MKETAKICCEIPKKGTFVLTKQVHIVCWLLENEIEVRSRGVESLDCWDPVLNYHSYQ